MKPYALLIAAVVACRDDLPPHDATTTSGGSTSTPDPTEARGGQDSTGAGDGAACLDDYDGHQDHHAALELGLDTSSMVIAVLGDGLLMSPAEIGADQLTVCSAAPSDFFAFEAQCPGRISLEVRKLDGSMPDLVLHSGAGQLVEHVDGTWSRKSFLKPLQRRIDAGVHVVEVRHAGGEPSRYSLTVMVLPACR